MAQGAHFVEATAQAEAELAAALAIGAEEAWPEALGIHLNILSGDESTSTYLLAASAVIAQAAVLRAGENGSADANLQELLNVIALDFEEDGQISWDLVSLLDRGEQALDTPQVVADLQNRLQDLGSAAVVPNLARAIDGDLDGRPGKPNPFPSAREGKVT